MEIADWSLLDWLDAGTAPLLAFIFLMLWRLDRRVLKIETRLDIPDE